MIKRLRLKFICISMGALLIMLFCIFITINHFMKEDTEHQIDRFLNETLKIESSIRPPRLNNFGEDRPYRPEPFIKGFGIKMFNNSEKFEIIFNDEHLSEESIFNYAMKVTVEGYFDGEIDNYKFKRKIGDEYSVIVYANMSLQNAMLNKLLKLSYIISSISTFILLILIIVLSKYITMPVEIAFEKQKRFIADSSHELKTPLSIISANIDMLKIELGNNKWFITIDNEIKRMDKLIHDMLILTKTENSIPKNCEFDLGKAIESVVLPMEVVAYEEGKTIELDLESGVIFNGNEDNIKKMIESLMENAIKYSKRETTIKGSLYCKKDYKIIEIYNEGIGIEKIDKEKLFEKFYRADASRGRKTGGYGIGLSIVKNIVDSHGGKIFIDSIPGQYVVFKIILN